MSLFFMILVIPLFTYWICQWIGVYDTYALNVSMTGSVKTHRPIDLLTGMINYEILKLLVLFEKPI